MRLWTLALVAMVAACGSDDGGGPVGSPAPSGGGGAGSGGAPSQSCVPGTTVACLGPGACQGAQPCKTDGSGYEACDCGGAGAGGATAGTGGAGGQSAGAGGASCKGKAEDCSGSDDKCCAGTYCSDTARICVVGSGPPCKHKGDDCNGAGSACCADEWLVCTPTDRLCVACFVAGHECSANELCCGGVCDNNACK